MCKQVSASPKIIQLWNFPCGGRKHEIWFFFEEHGSAIGKSSLKGLCCATGDRVTSGRGSQVDLHCGLWSCLLIIICTTTNPLSLDTDRTQRVSHTPSTSSPQHNASSVFSSLFNDKSLPFNLPLPGSHKSLKCPPGGNTSACLVWSKQQQSQFSKAQEWKNWLRLCLRSQLSEPVTETHIEETNLVQPGVSPIQAAAQDLCFCKDFWVGHRHSNKNSNSQKREQQRMMPQTLMTGAQMMIAHIMKIVRMMMMSPTIRRMNWKKCAFMLPTSRQKWKGQRHDAAKCRWNCFLKCNPNWKLQWCAQRHNLTFVSKRQLQVANATSSFAMKFTDDCRSHHILMSRHDACGLLIKSLTYQRGWFVWNSLHFQDKDNLYLKKGGKCNLCEFLW